MSTHGSSVLGPAEEEYLRILDLTYEVAQALQGKIAETPGLPNCQQLVKKLFFHAASIYWLRRGTQSPVPYSTQGESFCDFASIAVLTRAVFDTYLALFSVFLEPTTQDEFEFRHTLWQLSGFVVREGIVPSDPTLGPRYAEAQREVQDLRRRIERTARYKSLTPRQQKDVLNGRTLRGWRDVARAAGFGEQTIQKIYAYYSSYVHADGLSGTQIASARTRREQEGLTDPSMNLVISILSKVIVGYAQKFTEASIVCSKNPDVFQLAQVYSGAAHLP